MLRALHEQREEPPVHAWSALHRLPAQLRAFAREIDRFDADTHMASR